MTTKKFQYFFTGSAVERYGIPLMRETTGSISALREYFSMGPLETDLDVMFCSLEDQASFSGLGNILIEPLVSKREGFFGYAQLTSLTPGYERQCVSSKVIRDQAIDAVGYMPEVNLPGISYCYRIEDPKVLRLPTGPAIKLHRLPLFEADVTICFHCSEWPPMSDWSSRQRYWPSADEAQMIMSLGCHLVPKPAPSDEEETSWRFSFSLAEIELSKLVPDIARKCFLALKIILKDHPQPITLTPAITSYHIKTIFLNTLEKMPVGFWVDGNIEECFLTLLAEHRDALASMNCPHHWFSFVNLFDKETSCFCIETRSSQRLAKKVQTFLNNPAPFIFDDGCCFLSQCCLRAPHNNVTRRTSEEFHAEYDEVMLSADGHVIAGAHNPIDPVSNRYQLSVSPSPRCEAQLDPGLNHGQEITTEPEQLVTSFPPMHNAEQEPSFCPGEAEDDSFNGSLPISVTSPLLGFQARLLQIYMAA
ncbi:cyclic GMP-AMP synthase-like receptor 2 [Oculina patagonica]